MNAEAAWVRVAAVADVAGHEVRGVEWRGQRLALYRLPDGIYATVDRCPHAGARLSGGCVVDGHIECPVHFSLFDIRTGATDGSVTGVPLRTVPVRVEHGDILVDVSGLEEAGR